MSPSATAPESVSRPIDYSGPATPAWLGMRVRSPDMQRRAGTGNSDAMPLGCNTIRHILSGGDERHGEHPMTSQPGEATALSAKARRGELGPVTRRSWRRDAASA